MNNTYQIRCCNSEVYSEYTPLQYLLWDLYTEKDLSHFSSCAISGFRRNIDEICALLGSYAAQSGDSATTQITQQFEKKMATAYSVLSVQSYQPLLSTLYTNVL